MPVLAPPFRVGAAALTSLALALLAGCGDDGRMAVFDAGFVEDLPAPVDLPVVVDVARDAGVDVPADRGFDAPTVRDVGATTDVPLDRPADVVDAPALVDRPFVDGGYVVGEVGAAAPSLVGGASVSVDTTAVSECAAGEVAVGVAVGLEGRGYVSDARLECAALDATGVAFASAHWAGADPPSDWNVAHCPAGQHVIGLLGAAGDILDRLGAQCAALGWATSHPRTPLGPWGGAATDTTASCPPSSAVQRLAVSQGSYFGGPTALGAEARCRRVAPR